VIIIVDEVSKPPGGGLRAGTKRWATSASICPTREWIMARLGRASVPARSRLGW
jgi:hypothetical protein